MSFLGLSLALCDAPLVPSVEQADVQAPPGSPVAFGHVLHLAAASIAAASPSGKLATAFVLRSVSRFKRPIPLLVRILLQCSGGNLAQVSVSMQPSSKTLAAPESLEVLSDPATSLAFLAEAPAAPGRARP